MEKHRRSIAIALIGMVIIFIALAWADPAYPIGWEAGYCSAYADPQDSPYCDDATWQWDDEDWQWTDEEDLPYESTWEQEG
jgi:hypothetical protein